MYGIDDGLILFSFVCHLGEAIATMLALSHGLGQTIGLMAPGAVSYVSESVFASIILYILSAAAGKASTLYLMMRLFNLHGRKSHTNHHERQRLYLNICFGILLLSLLWGAASIVAVSAKCETSTLIEASNVSRCTSQYLRWQIITGFDVATEALLMLNAIVIVAPVRLALHLKFQVVCAFLFRLPLIALSVLRLHYVQNATTASNPGTAQSPIMVLQQVYLCWSIISATLPNLKAFVRSFGSGFGIGIDMETYTNAYGSGKNSSGQQKSYEMGHVGSRTGRLDGSNALGSRAEEEHVKPIRSVNGGQGGFRHGHSLPRSAHGQQHYQGEEREVDSIESTSSDAQIIRKDVGWDVRYEDRHTPTAI